MDPVTETPERGRPKSGASSIRPGTRTRSTSIWSSSKILDRQPFDLNQYPGGLAFTGPRVPPPANERHAPKDTVKLSPARSRGSSRGSTCRRARVDPRPAFRYVLHCHILEHEDNDMMRPYDVVG